jgi:eukaryotic-like serine/threonine-protein kinase
MSDDPFIGKTLGRYRIEAKLGQGGMGAVYRGVDASLDRAVAVKVLPPHFAAQPEFLERFRREARKAAQLTHANIVQVYEVGEHEGTHFIAMQYLGGGSLADRIQEQQVLPPMEAARIVRDVGRGLAKAHKAGVIHRDMKPANIFLDEDGDVRVGDFGLVKDLAGGDQPLTATGTVLGTPHYMAPEQCQGLPEVDGRVDLYALGLILYQCLSGVLPVQGTTPLQIISHRLQADPTPLGQLAPHTPPALQTIVQALLVRDRDRRLGDAGSLVAMLDQYLSSSTSQATMPVVTPPSSSALQPTLVETPAPGAAYGGARPDSSPSAPTPLGQPTVSIPQGRLIQPQAVFEDPDAASAPGDGEKKKGPPTWVIAILVMIGLFCMFCGGSGQL